MDCHFQPSSLLILVVPLQPQTCSVLSPLKTGPEGWPAKYCHYAYPPIRGFLPWSVAPPPPPLWVLLVILWAPATMVHQCTSWGHLQVALPPPHCLFLPTTWAVAGITWGSEPFACTYGIQDPSGAVLWVWCPLLLATQTCQIGETRACPPVELTNFDCYSLTAQIYHTDRHSILCIHYTIQ